MTIDAIDHLYLETHSFEKAVAFWEALGFRLVQRWGTHGHVAGMLKSGGATIVLAEAPEAADTPVTVHFGISNADGLAERLQAVGDAVAIETPLEATHWGTRWLRLRDPDGRVFALEEARPS